MFQWLFILFFLFSTYATENTYVDSIANLQKTDSLKAELSGESSASTKLIPLKHQTLTIEDSSGNVYNAVADSALFSSTVESTVVLDPGLGKREKNKKHVLAGVGISWNILIVPELNNWQRAVKIELDSEKTNYKTQKDFEAFSNTSSPCLTVESLPVYGFRLGLDIQGFYINKSMEYIDTTSGKNISFVEKISLQGVPVISWIITDIKDSLFSVNGYDRLYVGLGVLGLPWIKISVGEENGVIQRPVIGKGNGIGYAFKIGLSRQISSRWDYHGIIQYGSAVVRSFDTNSGILNNRELLGDMSKKFELNYGCIQVLFKFVLHKPRLVKGERQYGGRRQMY